MADKVVKKMKKIKNQSIGNAMKNIEDELDKLFGKDPTEKPYFGRL